jgi:hypothetical protein
MRYQLEQNASYILNPHSQKLRSRDANWLQTLMVQVDMPQFIMIQTYLDLGLGTDTWSDEDFIGRVSRVNRRVNTIESPIQTIKKCLIHYKMEWEKACATWAPGSSKMLPSLWLANRASRACWWQAKEGILGNSMGPQRVTYQDVRYSTNRALFVNSNTFYHVHFFDHLRIKV